MKLSTYSYLYLQRLLDDVINLVRQNPQLADRYDINHDRVLGGKNLLIKESVKADSPASSETPAG